MQEPNCNLAVGRNQEINFDVLKVEYHELFETARSNIDLTIKASMAYLAIEAFGAKFLFDASRFSALSVGLMVFLTIINIIAFIGGIIIIRYIRFIADRMIVISEKLGLAKAFMKSVKYRVTFLGTVCIVGQAILTFSLLIIYFCI